MEQNKNTGRKELLKFSPRTFEDSITYEKIHRHLCDINDTITEEDIKNVRTDFTILISKISVKEEVVIQTVIN